MLFVRFGLDVFLVKLLMTRGLLSTLRFLHLPHPLVMMNGFKAQLLLELPPLRTLVEDGDLLLLLRYCLEKRPVSGEHLVQRVNGDDPSVLRGNQHRLVRRCDYALDCELPANGIHLNDGFI